MKFEANTKTLFKVVSTSETNTDITKGNTYEIYSDVDNEWYIIDDDVGFDLAIIGDEELGDDGDGEQIFEELSNSTVTLVDVPDW